MNRGLRCEGWLFLPDTAKKPPVVVMAHGFGGLRNYRLPAFAERFVQQGLAVYLFEYRNFGDSEGEPRNWISPRRHLQDWRAAIAHVRTFPNVDGGRMALWGTSFSGGHVIVTAARVPGIRAIVSQVPFVDGIASISLIPLRSVIAGFIHGLRDLVRMITFRRPHLIPIVGDATLGVFGALNAPDCREGVLAIVPEGAPFTNECPARICLTLGQYRPIRYAKKISCPALFIIAERDSLIPAKAVRTTVARVSNAQSVELDAGHFEVYVGDLFEKVVAIEANFLAKHLLA